MNRHRLVFCTFFVLNVINVSLHSCSASGQELPAAFNGKDFTGWQEPEKNFWWTAEEGVLTAKSDSNRVGSILWTEREFKNFIFEGEFMFGEGTVDSGVFLRNSKEQIQIGISGSLKRDLTASPYIDGKGYPVEAEGVKELLKPTDWNTLTIVAKGKTYTVWLNNRYVMNYDSESAIEKGPIGLQLHPGNEMSISFRKLRIAELE